MTDQEMESRPAPNEAAHSSREQGEAQNHSVALWLFPVGANKAPILRGNGHHDASNDPEQWAKWTAEPGFCWFGINLEKSRLAVLDPDVKRGKDGWKSLEELQADQQLQLPETFQVETPSGGGHLFFRLPESPFGEDVDDLRVRLTNGQLGTALDYLASGYVVLYDFDRLRDALSSNTVAVLPAWVRGLVRSVSKKARGLKDEHGQAKLDLMLREGFQEGERDAGITKLAGFVKATTGSGEMALLAAREANRNSPAPLDEAQVEKCVSSVFSYGDAVDPLDIPAWLPNQQAEVLREVEDPAVMAAVKKRLVDDRARQLHKQMTEPPMPSFELMSLGDLIATAEPTRYRIDGLQPLDSSIVLVAPRKTGKSTLALNWCRALLTGEPFLGQFEVKPIDGSIAYLNFEVSGNQFARWAAEHHLDRERMTVVNLRGRRNPFNHEEDMGQLAAMLKVRGTKALVVDPFANVFTGSDQNSNSEVSTFLLKLGRWTRAEVGATELLLPVHAGWAGERSRGASALEDWPDAIWNLTKDDAGQRFFKANGRDVDVAEDALGYDHTTRSLSLTGGGNRQKVAQSQKTTALLFGHIFPLLEEGFAFDSVRALEKELKERGVTFSSGDVGKALLQGERSGALVKGPTKKGNGKAYTLASQSGSPEVFLELQEGKTS
ncbi:AAA family ATPase [Aestuariimicrobium sp. T2.26MG-19.2B]|uniref:AAA family ATPase n=1 Tax=Aestuariimicrobium sp. T2.26MG-19.2B TaxID=3040679 RepID=UPI0024777A83|nr:AAA family ATPase [Aestuariimicrobium sp. T2.26MG-19.2B]CAI9400405.1 hypothetical protein AESSP_00381 [Aestuariimicrobium sp. T2.26MG-19.2B]